MAEIKATENGLGIQADKITLEGPETEYVTLAAVEYDPYEGMDCEGNEKDTRPESEPWNAPEEWIWTGYVLSKASYEVRDPHLHMLLLGFGQSLTSLPVVETKIEEVRVEN